MEDDDRECWHICAPTGSITTHDILQDDDLNDGGEIKKEASKLEMEEKLQYFVASTVLRKLMG